MNAIVHIVAVLAAVVGCVSGKTVTYHWTAKYKQSMYFGDRCKDTLFLKHCANSYIAYQRDGTLFYRNTSINTGEIGIEQRVPDDAVDSVLVADGYYRSVPTINGMVPGPTIEVTEGDTVVVVFTNQFVNEATSIHFHGMFQHGTPWMDGVSAITQCGVLPFETFTYRFIAEPAGTHSWHAHHGVERPDGLYGPLIVHPKAGPSAMRRALLGDGAETAAEDILVLTVQDHEASQTTYTQHDGGAGWYENGPEAKPDIWTRDVSGKLVGENPFRSALINGRGRFKGEDQGGSSGAESTNLTVFRVRANTTHAFRIVSSQESLALRVSVDGFNLMAFASDGAEFEPVEVESVVVHPGESFDVAVRVGAQSAGSSFWVRAETLEVDVEDGPHSALAVLLVSADAEDDDVDAATADPTTERRKCTAAKPCVVLNCPFPAYGAPEEHTTCMLIDEVRSTAASAKQRPVPAGEPDERLFLNFVFEPAINNRRFVYPAAPPLTQPLTSGAVPCDDALCDVSGFPTQPCECTHTKELGFNRTVELVLTNVGGSGFSMHPVHLHGHHFHVLAVGMPPHDEVTGRVCVFYEGDDHPTCFERDDLECAPGSGCASAVWKDGVGPALNFDRPPLKDTVVVPAGGWTIVRFTTDNPGLWHLHCHMAHHLESGMGMLLNSGKELQHLFPAPDGFPTCGSLDDTPSLEEHVASTHASWEALLADEL